MGWFFAKEKVVEKPICYVEDFILLNKLVAELISSQDKTRQEIDRIKDRIDDKVREELHTVERKYIKFLEDKLIRFDSDVSQIKEEIDRAKWTKWTALHECMRRSN